MWFEFSLAMALVVLCFYVPGFFFFRGLRADPVFSFACAPFYSLLCYCIAACAYPVLGIRASFASITFPALAMAVLVWLCSLLLARRRSSAIVFGSKQCSSSNFSIMAICLYIGIGLIATAALYVHSLNGAASYVPTFDNVHHYNLVRSFVDSGNWSSLTTSVYPWEDIEAGKSPFPGGEYYPAAWHLMAALAVDALSIPVTVAANAVNATMTSVVFPSGICLLMLRVIPEERWAVILGSVFTPAFCAFPWVLLNVWPLFPNALSLALFAQMAASFVSICSSEESRHKRAVYLAAFIMGLAGSVFVQPNAVFTVAVFLIPFCVWRAVAFSSKRFEFSPRRRWISCAFGIATACLCLAIWVVCYKLPFLQSIIQYYWPPSESIVGAVKSVISLAFIGSSSQIALAMIVAIGVIATLFYRRYLWLSFSYGFACVIFIVANSLGDVPLKHFLSGFWYTDPYRVAAFSAVFAIPLASFGASMVMRGIIAIAKKLGAKPTFAMNSGVAVVLVAAFSLLNFSHTSILSVHGTSITAIGAVYDSGVNLNNSESSWVYDDEEAAFVNEALAIVEDGATVINLPFDGSLLAFGINGMDTYYRTIGGYGIDSESDDSVIIRTSLDRIASDREVSEAVKDVSAKYVLILDRNEEELANAYPIGMYNPEDWVGLRSITDTTPGFDVVLSKGEMRLYRIVV